MRMFGFQPKPEGVHAVGDRCSLLPRRWRVLVGLSGVLVALIGPVSMAGATTSFPSVDPIFVVSTPDADAPIAPVTPACDVVEKVESLSGSHANGPVKKCLSGFLSSTLNDNLGSRWK